MADSNPNRVKYVKARFDTGDIKYCQCPDIAMSDIDCLRYGRQHPELWVNNLPTDFVNAPCLDRPIIIKAVRCIKVV